MNDEASPIRILIVDDHPVVREGVAALVGGQSDMGVVGEASNGREAIQQFRAQRPDTTMMEIQMAVMSGLNALIAIRDEAPVVFVTALSGRTPAVGAKTQAAVMLAQQVTVRRIISPTVTDEDIALLRQDIRAMKMQVIGENMSLSDTEAQKFRPIYKHYADDLHEVNNAIVRKQYCAKEPVAKSCV